MNVLLRTLSAEALKLRGTLAAWMCLIAPSLVVALYVLQMATSDYSKRAPAAGADAWSLFAQSTMVLWALLMLPLFVTLQAALLAGLDHGPQRWKHLLALPLPRSSHYFAKALALAAMVAAATMSMVVLVPVGGWVLSILQPKFGIAGPAPWAMLVERSLAATAAAMLIVALHTWAALRWRSFTVAVSIGMTATVAGFLVGQSARFGRFYPWSLPLQVHAADGRFTTWAVAAGLAGGVALTVLGAIAFARREVD
ncbi:ABC transporter permease [Lysobacter sp. A6]|uniref:ABC transporter permease n=1 Tax=Noviluteimonas lactosilytica TaxID=2888523 RepID=A0ABS8JM44_9GAMM|nr:ABC transporter permease [Lysobacter lactosilyticus]MCC8364554.1 ABC transporter permease [Lysobacter lactosilyticus]